MSLGIVASSFPFPTLAGATFVTGTYSGTGSGTNSPSLSSACDLVFVSGEPNTDRCVAFAARDGGTRDGLRVVEAGSSTWATQLALASDGLSITASGTSGDGLNVSSTTYNYLGLSGFSIITGTYTGNAVEPQTITPSEAVYAVFISGTPTNYVQAFALRNTTGIRAASSDSTGVALVTLNSSGTSFDVIGTGASGLNRSGTTYYYVGITEAPTESSTYTGSGSDPKTVSLSSAANLVIVQGVPGDTLIAYGWPTDQGGVHYKSNTFWVQQLSVASDGLSFDVTGTGTGGLNKSATSYTYMTW